MAGKRILIVEDESIVARDIQHSLKTLGYSVAAIAATGEEAITQTLALKPDLVLMDIMLKGPLDGIQAVQHIRSKVKIPIVYLTAYTDEQTLSRAKASEAFGYLLKPFEDRELRTTIEMALSQHTMECRLIESREWLETTLRCLGDAVIAADNHDCVQLINPIAEMLTGWSRTDAIGRKLTDVFCLKDKGQSVSAEQFKTKVRQGQTSPVFGKDSILIARDGHPVPVDHNAAPILGENESLHGVVLVFRDVTDRAQVKEREQYFQERLARSKRMESLGILAGGVAHDLNKILGPMVDYPGLIKEKLPSDSALHSDLAMIENSSRKALDIVHDLLTLGRIGHVPMEPVSLNDIVDDCLKSPEFQALQNQAAHVVMKTQLTLERLPVLGSRQHLHEVVIQLIINAYAAIPSEGRVSLTTSLEQFDQAFEGYEVIEPGKYVVLHVTNTGPEIREENISQIFEPFYTKRSLGWEIGSGLGLAVVYGVVKAHQGFLNVISAVKTGSDFAVYFPVSGFSGESLHKPESVTYQGLETILLIEDDEYQRKTTARWLRHRGYKVLPVPNGKAAFETFQTEKSMAPLNSI